MNSVTGSRISNSTKLAQWSRKNASHRLHSVVVPVIITFTSLPECEPVK